MPPKNPSSFPLQNILPPYRRGLDVLVRIHMETSVFRVGGYGIVRSYPESILVLWKFIVRRHQASKPGASCLLIYDLSVLFPHLSFRDCTVFLSL